MDSFTFITKLQDLKLPADIGDFNKYDYDWLFCDKKNEFCISFWEWFCSNVSASDLLSDEEITGYEKQLSDGSVLSGKHLEQMEAYLEPFSSELETTHLNVNIPDSSENELENLEDELQLLIKRKNHLSLQKLTLKENLNKKEILVKKLNAEFEQEKAAMKSLCQMYSKSVAELSSSVDKVSSEFILFSNKADENEAVFTSQLPVCRWQKEELTFRDSILKYINKQFQEGVDIIAGQNDSSLYCLLDAGQIDIHLVRGPKQSEYITNVKELNRISKLLEESEINHAECEILKTQRSVEMEEARKFMKMIKTQPSYSYSLLQQKIFEAREARCSFDLDLKYQLKYLKEQAIIVAQLERLKTISGNYEVKLKRQEYFLGKQDLVINHLLEQLSRYDFIKIILDVEKSKIREVLEVLVKLNTFLIRSNQEFMKRMDCLKQLKEISKQPSEESPEVLLSLIELLKPLEKSFGTDNLKNFMSKFVRNLDILEVQINSAEVQSTAVMKSQMNAISKIHKSCAILEDCLFGNDKVLGTLPALWISGEVISRQADVEQAVCEFQQKMLNLLRDYEGKKKIYQENPAVRERLVNWIGSVKNLNLK